MFGAFSFPNEFQVLLSPASFSKTKLIFYYYYYYKGSRGNGLVANTYQKLLQKCQDGQVRSEHDCEKTASPGAPQTNDGQSHVAAAKWKRWKCKASLYIHQSGKIQKKKKKKEAYPLSMAGMCRKGTCIYTRFIKTWRLFAFSEKAICSIFKVKCILPCGSPILRKPPQEIKALGNTWDVVYEDVWCRTRHSGGWGGKIHAQSVHAMDDDTTHKKKKKMRTVSDNSDEIPRRIVE